MGKKSAIKWGILIAFFLISFIFVEGGIAGSRVVAKYNDGYGTFDMKSYDSEIVRDILGDMSAKGINVYKLYYLFDFIFIIAFGILQCKVSIALYRWCKLDSAWLFACVIPLIRGLTDFIENVLLLKTLFSFPVVNDIIIKSSSVCTQVKLAMIPLWGLEVLMGIIATIVARNHLKR